MLIILVIALILLYRRSRHNRAVRAALARIEAKADLALRTLGAAADE